MRRLRRLAAALPIAAALVLTTLLFAPPAAASTGSIFAEDCSSGPRTLQKPGSRMYPDQGNGGYTSIHTDLHINYDTLANLFLPGTRAELTIRSTQCLTDFSFDFERTAMSGSAAGPNMTVDSVLIDGVPAAFDFRQPTYPGNPNGPDDPDPLAHQISNVNPVSATNPNPPACSPQTSASTQNGQPCPANKLVITPATPILEGTTITVTVNYSGRPGVHLDGDGSTEGWFRVNTAAAPNDGSFVTTEPVGSMAWMPLNNHPSAKVTYDVYDTVPVGKTAIAPGRLVGYTPPTDWTAPPPTSVNAPDANFPGGSWTWHWSAPEPIASYLVTNTIGSYDLMARTSTTSGIHYFQAMASGLTAARKTTIKAVLDQQEDITRWQETFAGPFPFNANGVIVALPSVGFAEEMQTKITFGNGASSTPSIQTFHHEVFHQWFGDYVAESSYEMTFWKEGWATVSEYLNTARTAANTAGGLGTPAGNAAFDNSLIARFNTNYGTGGTNWTSAPSDPTVGNLFSTFRTYTRSGTTYLALRQILGASASRPASDRWIMAMREILSRHGGGSITQPQLEQVFHDLLPNQSAGCQEKLDQFFTQWFDTAYASGGGANRPQITGPGLAGGGFYDDASACTRADQAIAFGPLANRGPEAPDFVVTATSDSGLPVSFAADGPCTVTGATVHLTGALGVCTITASQAGDGVFKPAASVAQSFVVHAPVVTDDTAGGVETAQYSDAVAVVVSATDAASAGSTLAAVATGLPAGVSLTLASTSPGATLPGARTWNVSGFVTAAPGSYPVTVTVTNDGGSVGSTSFTIEVPAEDAQVGYGGETLAYTAAGGSGTAVLLRAVLRDSSAVPGSGDSAPGDIRNATVTFREGSDTLCGPLPVQLIGGATTVATATCVATLPLGVHAVDVVAGGYYIGEQSVRVDVLAPVDGRTTADGSIVAGASAGAFAADPGSSIRADVDVRYRAGVKGTAEVGFDSSGKRYRVVADSIDSLGTALDAANERTCSGTPPVPVPSLWCTGQTQLRATASLIDDTKKKPVVVATGLTLQIAVTDRRAAGAVDSLGITLWSGNALLFSSSWTGVATVEQSLAGGSVRVQ